MENAKRNALLSLAKRAMAGFAELNTQEKLTLLEALGFILPPDEALEVRHTAFIVEKAALQQLKFQELLNS